MAEYMIVEDNIITGIYCGYEETQPIYNNQGILVTPATKIIPENSVELPATHEVRVGEPLTFYNSDFTRKSDIQLMQEYLIPIPQGYKIENNNLIEMSYEEKIVAGLESLPYGMKIVDAKLVAMTEDEILATMTVEEKAAYHRQKRDALLNAEIWKVERHNQEVLLERETTLSNDEFMNLLRYIQELRDLTEQPNFPNVVTYPSL